MSFPEADLGFLVSTEAQVAFLKDRLLLLGCTAVWILADDLASRLLGFPSGTAAPPAPGVLKTGALLHGAAVCATVAAAFGAVAGAGPSRGARWLVAWGLSVAVLLGLCERQLLLCWRAAVVPSTAAGMLQAALLALSAWTAWLVLAPLKGVEGTAGQRPLLDAEAGAASPGASPLLRAVSSRLRW